jgi:hypothetical protein
MRFSLLCEIALPIELEAPDIDIDEFIGVAQYNHITPDQAMTTIRLMGEHIIPEYKAQAQDKAAVAAE